MNAHHVFATAAVLTALSCGAWAQTQAEVDSVKASYLQADKSMNALYKSALAVLDGEAEKNLVAAQEAWDAYRAAMAEAQSNVYSSGNTRTLVYYTVMREVTDQHITRLKDLVAETGQPDAATPAAPADPFKPITDALSSAAIQDKFREMDTRLNSMPEIRSYLDVVVPSVQDLDDILAQQGLEPRFLDWVKANPDQARRVATLAVAQELDSRAKNNQRDWDNTSVVTVTQYLRSGGLKGAVGQIGSELLIKPQHPYRFYDYLHNQRGLATVFRQLLDPLVPSA